MTTPINTLIQQIHSTATTKGFWPAWTDVEGVDTVDINFVLAKIALGHSEFSETLEAVRKQQGSDKVMEEIADIVIRTFDLVGGMHRFGWIDSADLEAVIAKKMGINNERPKMHGNLA